MANTSKTRVLTANRLGDGRVVYLGGEGWTSQLDEARLISSDAEADTAERDGQLAVVARLIVEPYLVDVDAEAASIIPVRLRERIRAVGPTTGNSRSAAA